MSSQRWMLAVCFSLASVFVTGQLVTRDTEKNICRTFGSGVVQPFVGMSFYVRSNCAFTLTHFTHNRVECDITIRRDDSGLLVKIEITINKIRTVLQNGSILVEGKSISLPYDHTYQHIFPYGIYTKLKSSLLPLSVTWHNVPGGIDTVLVELEQELSTEMTGLCGNNNPSTKQELTRDNVLTDSTCQTRDVGHHITAVCGRFFSHSWDCLQATTMHYMQLCNDNIYNYENSKYIGCAFFKQIVEQCGNQSQLWNIWRSITNCVPVICPGDLVYVDQGAAFIPSCSIPNPDTFYDDQELISSCICPMGKVLNDHANGFNCVYKHDCSCVFDGKKYSTGDTYSTKCQLCECDSGKWKCSENSCPPICSIESEFVKTFDGKRYVLPGKCTYVASQGPNWMITIKFSQEKAIALKTVVLQLYQEKYTFSPNMVKIGDMEITDLHQSAHALVFWQSSMYIQIQTSFGMKIQIQVSPEIQLYITPSEKQFGMLSGLCGNSNKDTTDDFTTGSGIIENSAQAFAQSWSLNGCSGNISTICIKTNNEIFAEEKCSVLNKPSGIFAKCHGHIPTDYYHTACIQRTCNCGSNLQQCLCIALGNYAKACASLGVLVGDWRKATNCSVICQKNQEFSYNMQACNNTCRSLSGLDPSCGVDGVPVEGCGCPEGTHLNGEQICSPKADCPCHYNGGTMPPGSHVIQGRQCICDDGKLECSMYCGCTGGKVCVHCAQSNINTAQKTCDSLSKPMGMTCTSGCYCPDGQYEDHNGNCVSKDSCTCVYSGKIFSKGQRVETYCKSCVCDQGQWDCKDEPCLGKCQVYGNGHIQTFDSKWYRFGGQCRYMLVEDDCGYGNGTFSVRVESVPCCDEALTCSRSVILSLKDKVTLTLSDMKVTRHHHSGWTLKDHALFSVHTVGLYIIISVPSKGITLIWDKNTQVTVKLHPHWRNQVCGLCGDFDSNEMNDLQISGSGVMSSPLAFGNSWKTATPPCSDVTTDVYPCEHHSYCAALAQRSCMILKGDTFKECHFKVDPGPYFDACVLEACSCQFKGSFLGFCTAVAAYAEACSDNNVCISWRRPDLCPVFCDYYNEKGQCIWHYDPCGEMQTCGTAFTHKLEGCYPRCPNEKPYYDENTGECTKLRDCTCYKNGTIIQPGEVVQIDSVMCLCENGTITCPPPPPTITTTTTTTTTTPTTPTTSLTSVSTTTENWSTKTSKPTTTSTTPSTTSLTSVSTTTENWSTKTSKPTTSSTTTSTTTSTTPSTTTSTTPSTTTSTTPSTTTSTTPSTTPVCECKDLKRKKSWRCGETWIEDCFNMMCKDQKIELSTVVCPQPTIPNCPRNQVTKVSDGCCETYVCDCRCELYGDPHYISFQGVNFDFMEDCTYVLVEEMLPSHHLTIAADNVICMPGISGTCAKGVILKYLNNTATLNINSTLYTVQATLNNMPVEPPYEEKGLRFETTGYVVTIYLPAIRSYVSLSPSWTLVVSLAMEYFDKNTQGQCGVCGGPSCIRRDGKAEDDNCCDKTAYEWVYPDPLKPACASRNVPCFTTTTLPTMPSTTICPQSSLCQLLDHPVFKPCSEVLKTMDLKKKNCKFDSCRNAGCSSLEQAAEECKKNGFCIEWRNLTNGRCDVPCSEGLVYKECPDKGDDFCKYGLRHEGQPLENNGPGCFCPSNQFKAGTHSKICVSNCSYCEGPLGEPRWPGDKWESNCQLCTCNNLTLKVNCSPKPPKPIPMCGPNAVLVNSSCCGDMTCIEKTCSYHGKTYKVGDRWRDTARPCMSFSCSKEGIQTETRVCPTENCPEMDRIWDNEHCCFTCKQTCALKVSNMTIALDNCISNIQIPVCQGQCVANAQPRLVLRHDLQVEQCQCCQECGSERRSITLQCSDHTFRQYIYKHITKCECKECG